MILTREGTVMQKWRTVRVDRANYFGIWLSNGTHGNVTVYDDDKVIIDAPHDAVHVFELAFFLGIDVDYRDWRMGRIAIELALCCTPEFKK